MYVCNIHKFDLRMLDLPSLIIWNFDDQLKAARAFAWLLMVLSLLSIPVAWFFTRRAARTPGTQPVTKEAGTTHGPLTNGTSGNASTTTNPTTSHTTAVWGGPSTFQEEDLGVRERLMEGRLQEHIYPPNLRWIYSNLFFFLGLRDYNVGAWSGSFYLLFRNKKERTK